MSVFAAGAAFALPSAASAATPISLGTSENQTPQVVVDEAGTGYITWSAFDAAQPGSKYVVRHCRLPQGSTTCSLSTFTYPSTTSATFGNAPVIADGGRNMVAVGLLNNAAGEYQTNLYTSTNGGVSFDGGELVGENMLGIEGSAEFIPANALFAGSPERIITTEGFGGNQYQATATTFLITGTFQFTAATTSSNSTTLQGGTHLVSYTTLTSPSQAFSRLYDGSGDPAIPSNWGPPVSIGNVGGVNTAKLISGPSGIYFAYTTEGGATAIKKYLAGGWGAPVEITGPLASGSGDVSVVESSSGIVHVAYVDADGAIKYRYARSTANDDFTRPQTIVPNEGNAIDFREPDLAVNAAGNGYVTYRPFGSASQVSSVIPISPGEGPETGGGAYTGPDTEVSVPGGFTFTVPANCVNTNSTFRVEVALKKKKKKGKGRVGALAKKAKTKKKIKRVDFSANGTAVASVKKKPFAATISTAGATGSIEVVAKVTLKVKKPGKKAKKVKKTIKQKVKIC